jgi:hypothetical protein
MLPRMLSRGGTLGEVAVHAEDVTRFSVIVVMCLCFVLLLSSLLGALSANSTCDQHVLRLHVSVHQLRTMQEAET